MAFGQYNDLPPEAPTQAAQYVCDRLFAEQDECAERGLITHSAFGAWYNDCGRSVIPWLEMLDLSKWKYITEPLTSDQESE